MESIENGVESGKVMVNGDLKEQQYEAKSMMELDVFDNNNCDFEANFSEREMGSGDEYEDDDRSFRIR